ncbi:hypothetical protein SVIRM249S_07068 [Streptomyces viridochromogenes]
MRAATTADVRRVEQAIQRADETARGHRHRHQRRTARSVPAHGGDRPLGMLVPVGAADHTLQEGLDLTSVPQRFALLAAPVAKLGDATGTPP